MHRFQFDHAYREPVVLRDGTPATVRLLRADDKQLLRRGFEQLSDASRYNRFFVRKSSLLDGELSYLTELDQVDHFALAAVRERAPSLDEPLAVARAVRLLLEPAVYEGAVTVIDAFQRLGLGELLLRRLVEAAGERGGRSLRFCVLPTNSAMQALLIRVAPRQSFVADDGVLRLDIPLRAVNRERARSAGE